MAAKSGGVGEGARLLDGLLGPGKAVYHTGGYLGDGEVVWELNDNRLHTLQS